MRTKSLLGPFLKSFKSIGIKDLPLVGGKNASLGEMTQKLKKSVRIPEGFAITAHAYRYFLEENGLRAPLQKILQEKDLTKASLKARNLFLKAKLPEALIKSITKGYKRLSTHCKTKNLDVAVRSSATAEDLPGASFAGQQESYLHIRGIKKLLHACKHCFASLFTERAIIYRNKQGFDHFDVALSIGVQKMVRSDKASSGVIFTLDTESGFRNVVFITGSYGVGESIVQGSVNTDEFYVFKPTKKLIYKQMCEKSIRIMQGKQAPTPVRLLKRFCITDKE
ncbi:MAG: PEP/pyruvate-binding domain-containing protein, partial [Chlamydiota bacterium]